MKDISPSETDVWPVAEAEGGDPTGLRTLREAVDPDALDALLPGCTGGTVTFEDHGYSVRATAFGQVLLTDR